MRGRADELNAFRKQVREIFMSIPLVTRLYTTKSWPRLRVHFVTRLNLPLSSLRFTPEQRMADGESSIFKDLDNPSLAFTSGVLLACLASSWSAKCKTRLYESVSKDTLQHASLYSVCIAYSSTEIPSSGPSQISVALRLGKACMHRPCKSCVLVLPIFTKDMCQCHVTGLESFVQIDGRLINTGSSLGRPFCSLWLRDAETPRPLLALDELDNRRSND